MEHWGERYFLSLSDMCPPFSSVFSALLIFVSTLDVGSFFSLAFNSQHPSIQFTMEKESEGKISFLDVQIERKEGKLSTGVYRKITHTDRYINYASHHHPKTKTGVIACLRNRAEKVCDQQSLESELSHLKKTIRANGYPPSLISQELH